MLRRRRTLILAPLFCLTLSCGVEEGVVARVGDQRVEVETIQHYLAAVTGIPWQDVDMRVASRLLDQFLEQEAVLVSLHKEGGVAAVDPGPRWTLVRRCAVEEWGPAPQVSEADVEREVEQRMGETLPPQVYLRQMLFDDPAAAAEAQARLADGEDFTTVSKELSLAPNAARGGELGWVVMGSQPEKLEEVIFSLAEGAVSEPIPGPGGYHLFQALQVRESGPPLRPRLEERVRRDLEVERERAHLQWCVDRALEKVGVEVFSVNLWFDYDGRFAGHSNEG